MFEKVSPFVLERSLQELGPELTDCLDLELFLRLSMRPTHNLLRKQSCIFLLISEHNILNINPFCTLSKRLFTAQPILLTTNLTELFILTLIIHAIIGGPQLILAFVDFAHFLTGFYFDHFGQFYEFEGLHGLVGESGQVLFGGQRLEFGGDWVGGVRGVREVRGNEFLALGLTGVQGELVQVTQFHHQLY